MSTETKPISLDGWRYERRIIELDKHDPCPRPFHHFKYVVQDKEKNRFVCVRDFVEVKKSHHPSMREPQWYG